MVGMLANYFAVAQAQNYCFVMLDEPESAPDGAVDVPIDAKATAAAETKDWRSKSHLDDHHMQHEPFLCDFCGVYTAFGQLQEDSEDPRQQVPKTDRTSAACSRSTKLRLIESPVDGR